MAGIALAATSPPTPLALRLRLSRFHLCFKIRGDDEMVSARADLIYDRHELVTFVDNFLRKRRAFHGNKLPALGAWELWSNGIRLDMTHWTGYETGHDTVEISATSTSVQTALVVVQMSLPPVYIDVPQRAIIVLPRRSCVFVILRGLQSSGNERKAKLQCVKKVELVADRSVTLKQMLPHADTSTSHISSALVRTRRSRHRAGRVRQGKCIGAAWHCHRLGAVRHRHLPPALRLGRCFGGRDCRREASSIAKGRAGD